MAPLLEVRGLNVELPTPAGWVRPVNEVSLHLDEGETLGLVGESGSGPELVPVNSSNSESPNKCCASPCIPIRGHCLPPCRRSLANFWPPNCGFL
jgi:hypothetical protein